jgi:hypothetical protein
MPLWLDLLRTPMAAPETRILRRMRFTWQALCLACAIWMGLFGHIHRIVGFAAVAGAVALMIATMLYTVAYLSRKRRADDAFLDRVTGEGR